MDSSFNLVGVTHGKACCCKPTSNPFAWFLLITTVNARQVPHISLNGAVMLHLTVVYVHACFSTVKPEKSPSKEYGVHVVAPEHNAVSTSMEYD